jgi:hypothetical protein
VLGAERFLNQGAKDMKTLAALLLALGLSLGLTACDEGPLEEAGEEVDEAFEDAGDGIDDAADSIEDAADDLND